MTLLQILGQILGMSTITNVVGDEPRVIADKRNVPAHVVHVLLARLMAVRVVAVARSGNEKHDVDTRCVSGIHVSE